MYDHSILPSFLRNRRAFLLWRKVLNSQRSEKRGTPVYDKVPVSIDGTAGYINRPETFVTFDEAIAALHNLTAQGIEVTGLGFCFYGQDDLVGVDLDKVFTAEGQLNPHHQQILTALPAWTEWSQSGEGLHIICARDPARTPGLRSFKNHDTGVELFVGAGFLALTLKEYYDGEVPLFDLNDNLRWLQDFHGTPNGGLIVTHEPIPPLLEFSRDQIEELHLRAKYKALLTGEDSVPWKEGDRSRALLSLVIAMLSKGWTSQQIHTVLYHSHALNIGLEHRRDDVAKAEAYLWGRVLKARAWVEKNDPSREAAEVFEVVQGGGELVPVNPAEARYREILNEIGRSGGLNSLDPESLKWAYGIAAEAAGMDPGSKNNIMDQLGKVMDWKTEAKRKEVLSYAKANFSPRTAAVKWIHTVGDDDRPQSTVENFQVLCQMHNIRIWRNDMAHDILVEGFDNVRMAGEQYNIWLSRLRDLAHRYGLNIERVREWILDMSEQNPFHPFKTYLDQAKWDHVSRLPQLLETLEVPPGKEAIRDKLVTKWLISIVSCIYGYRDYPPRGVLVIVGPEHIGKTSWFRYVIPPTCFKEGHPLNPQDKDSHKQGVAYTVVELGEISSTFRKSDLQVLKAHISNNYDELRLPYAHSESKWPRRTVYCGTENETRYVQDQYGGTRWWSVPVTDVDLGAVQAMRDSGALVQLWAEVKDLYEKGAPWWASEADLVELEVSNEDHRHLEPVERQIMDTFDWDHDRWVTIGGELTPVNPMTTTEIARHLSLSPSQQVKLPLILKRHTGQEDSENVRRKRARQESNGQWVFQVDTQGRPVSIKNRWWYMPPFFTVGDGTNVLSFNR